MNRKDLKEYFRTLVESTEKEQFKKTMLNENVETGDGANYEENEYADDLDDPRSGFYPDPDVGELARFHVLNNDVDAMLYRDNPDYRRAFKEALINDEVGYSEEYEKMTDSFSPYDK